MKTELCPRDSRTLDVARVEQDFSRPLEADVPSAVVRELQKVFPTPEALKGKIIGLTMPSRGIRDIALVLKSAVSYLKPLCKEVRILTAMGSHGGGTTEGEVQTAAHRGVTAEKVGAAIIANMQTQHIGTVNGVEAHVSQDALDCDAVVLVNRIKEHTDIDWPEQIPAGYYGLESGFGKILALGLSKLCAKGLHQHIPGIGLGAAIEVSARRILSGGEATIAGGLGIIENAFDETAQIVGVRYQDADSFFAEEAKALAYSKELMPSLPVMELDLLYCRYLGKDKSGQGMHTKSIGRSPYGYKQGTPWKSYMPSIYTIVGGGLTPGSHGNAIGVGLCQFITKRFEDDVDWSLTALNCLTAFAPMQAARPVVAENDRRALELALAVSPTREGGPRVAFIQSTLEMTSLWVTPTLLPEIKKNPRCRVTTSVEPLRFLENGYLDESYYWPGH